MQGYTLSCLLVAGRKECIGTLPVLVRMQEHFSAGAHSFLPVNNREPVHSFLPVLVQMQEYFSAGARSLLPVNTREPRMQGTLFQ